MLHKSCQRLPVFSMLVWFWNHPKVQHEYNVRVVSAWTHEKQSMYCCLEFISPGNKMKTKVCAGAGFAFSVMKNLSHCVIFFAIQAFYTCLFRKQFIKTCFWNTHFVLEVCGMNKCLLKHLEQDLELFLLLHAYSIQLMAAIFGE